MARDFPNNGDTLSSHPLPPRGRFRPEVGWWSPSLTRRARERNSRGVHHSLALRATIRKNVCTPRKISTQLSPLADWR
jgi:hypothetical protein